MRVELDDVTFRYGRHAVALRGISATWGTGVRGLLGVNGAGKTTLMRLLATLARPTTGVMTFDATDIAGRAQRRQVRRRIGYLPQTASWPGRFTVAEFCDYLAWMREVPSSRRAAAVGAALDRVGLADRADDRLGSLSGGMYRRAMLAQAIVHEPRLLVLDEPTAGLDPQQRVRIRSVVRDLASERLVVLSTHLVDDIGALASDVTVLHEGLVCFDGSPAQLEAAASDSDAGDSPLERGFAHVIAAAS